MPENQTMVANDIAVLFFRVVYLARGRSEPRSLGDTYCSKLIALLQNPLTDKPLNRQLMNIILSHNICMQCGFEGVSELEHPSGICGPKHVN